jgi:hypothetical protein
MATLVRRSSLKKPTSLLPALAKRYHTCTKEKSVPFQIRSHHGDNNRLLFSALKAIHGTDLKVWMVNEKQISQDVHLQVTVSQPKGICKIDKDT